ncbi:MAG: ankyrin repeat domain-containing protein, partial [Cyanobacteria bacterium]|nr:ankyrin repeat domain-containing protein [Cyanobacteriota bacterium]
MIAALNNQTKAVKWLIKNNLININDTNKAGWNALTLAANRDSLETIQTIFENFGKNIFYQYNQAGFTPFLAAAIGGAETVLTWFLEAKWGLDYASMPLSGKNGLILAAANNRISIIEKLCNTSFPIEARTFKGRTALMETALNGHLEAFQCLLDRHASIEVMDDNGWDAITLASNMNHTKI